MSLYIYYRVQTPVPAALAAAVQTMQARLRAAMPGLAASLHRRLTEPGDGTDPVKETWMEVYQFNGHADARAWARLEQALMHETGLLPAGIEGVRHAERFEPLVVPVQTEGH